MQPRSRRIHASRRPWLLSLLAMLLVVATEQIIEGLARQRDLEQERLAVLTDLATLRARIEGFVNAHLLLVHGLTAVISAHPQIDQEEFARIAQGLVDERHALRNIVGAPDLVASLVYPLPGNETVIGLDYRDHPVQGDVAQRAMRTGQSVLAGPVPLVQGGMGFILREPVFISPTTPTTPKRPWGLVSAVIEMDRLYSQAGLLDTPRLRLALQGSDGSGTEGAVFFGDPTVLTQDPVSIEIKIPGGIWRLAATPDPDWGALTPPPWIIRLTGFLIALAAAVMTYLLARGNAALTVSENRLRTLLDTIPDLVWLKDPDGRYLFCNPRFEQFFGAPESKIQGKRDHDFVPKELADLFRANDRAAIGAGHPRINEEWLTFASDGHKGLFETIKTPLHDRRGRLLGVLGIAREITERKRSEQVLRRQSELLDRTSRLAKVGGWEFEVDTLQGSWTDETARIHDLEPGGAISVARGLDAYEGESRRLIEQAVHAAIEDGQPYDLELELISATGARKWVRTIGFPVRDDSGRVVRVEGAIQDISSRKQAELAARQREAMLDTVFQVLPDLFFLMDHDGTIRDYRASRSSDLYVPPDTFIERRMQEVLPPAIGALFERNLVLVVRENRLVTYDYALTVAGAERQFEARLGTLPDKSQLIAVVRDITERKQAENEIRQLNAELEARVAARTAELAAINKELETFTYSVSHDLKAPLRAIDGYSRLLLEDHLERLDEEGRLFVSNVRQGVAQMSQLIEDLLAYSRMERHALQGIPIDLSALLRRLLTDAQAAIETSGATLEVELPPLVARADPDGLTLVLRNLLDNALKFHRPDTPPAVAIRGWATDATIRLTIQDQGIGFDMRFHDRIFEIFQRLQLAEDYPGTGVGLAIVRKAMQRMGGRIWAESASGQGAAFHLELPR